LTPALEWCIIYGNKLRNSVKGKSNLDERSKRAAAGGSAVPEVLMNGPRRRCGKITVAAHGKSPVSRGQDIAISSPYPEE
jgi:hypothetical protein